MFIRPTALELHTLVSDEVGRFPAMAGVRVERDQDGTARAIATNGRQITIVEWEEPIERDDQTSPGFAASVPVSHAKQMIKHRPRTGKPKLDCIEIDENTKDNTKLIAKLRDLESSTEKTIPCIEGPFPNWQNLVKSQAEPSMVVDIDFDTLSSILAVVKKHTTDSERTMTIGIAGYDKPVSIFAKDDQGNRVASYVAPKSNDGPKAKPTKQVWRFPETIKPIPAESSEPQAEPSDRQAEIDQEILRQLTADLDATKAELIKEQEASQKRLAEAEAAVKRLEEQAAQAERIREGQVKLIAELNKKLSNCELYEQDNGRLSGSLERAQKRIEKLQQELTAAVEKKAASYLPAQPAPQSNDSVMREQVGKGFSAESCRTKSINVSSSSSFDEDPYAAIYDYAAGKCSAADIVVDSDRMIFRRRN